MPLYEVDPLVSIHFDDVVNTFYPSLIDNSKLMIGCQNNLEVVSIDSEWKYKHEQIRLAKEKRRERPYPILYLKPHPTEIYTMATANATGNIVLWDIDYNKCIKVCSTIGSHPSICQGLSWNAMDTNILLSCSQNGSIYLWDRRQNNIIRKWILPSGAHGVSAVTFDPFRENLFSFIHEDNTIKLYNLSYRDLVSCYHSENNAIINTIQYNPYKSNILAAGCSDHSIVLLSANSRGYENLYTSLYHSSNEEETTKPTGIECEFEVRDISWNSQNPNLIMACGMADNNVISLWDIRRPRIPYRILHQTQRIKKVCWMSHPGSTTSDDYISVLQETASSTTIDMFSVKSLPLFADLVCMTPLSLRKYNELICVLNANLRGMSHIPEDLQETELCELHEPNNQLTYSSYIQGIIEEEGYIYSADKIKYLLHNYQYHISASCMTLTALCLHNAQVCNSYSLSSIASIWYLLATLVNLSTNQERPDHPTRSHSIVSPSLESTDSMNASLHHASSLNDMLKNVSFNSSQCLSTNDEIQYEPDLCHLNINLSLNNELSFLHDLIHEGDLQDAITISLVFWNYLKQDETSIKEVQTWLKCFIDLLYQEEMYEEVIMLRSECVNLGVPLTEVYMPEITFQTATKQDERNFSYSPVFFAMNGQPGIKPDSDTLMDEIPFIETGKSTSQLIKRKSEKKGKRSMRQSKTKDFEFGMTRSRRGDKENVVNSVCSVCHAKNDGLVAMCLRCGHGGHLDHIKEWFTNDVCNKERRCAVATCNCHCVFSNDIYDSVQ